MHWLTKMLVLFVAVLSLLLSALTMAFAVNVDRIRTDYQNERDRRITSETDAEAAISQASQDKQRLVSEMAAVQSERDLLKARLNDLEAQNGLLIVEKRRAEDLLASLGAKIGGLGESVRTLTAQNAAYREEVLSLRQAEYGYRTREISLEDRINELEASEEVLQQDRRALLEQIAELQDVIASAESGTEPGAGPVIGPPIQGRVVEIKTETETGRIYARINVGTNDKVQERMRFSVLRDRTEFVGYLTITKADLQWAIGQFDDLDVGKKIQNGDLVLSRLE
ncbi:MAG: hypothetical protein IIC49_01495 [Planctomycetes bacterium]|nr:hypothetical protein [Planctomycetota bacterium]